MTVFGDSLLKANEVEMKALGHFPINHDWCSNKKRLGHRQTWGDHVKTRTKYGHLQGQERAPERNHPCQYLHLELIASRILKT